MSPYKLRPFQTPPRAMKSVTTPYRFLHESRSPFLDLEIGAGVGWHAIQYCQRHPDRHLIAIERTQKGLRALRRLQNHSPLPNLDFICDDFLNWGPEHLKSQSLNRIFILYPNPYPKPKHQNKRWAASPVMEFLIQLLKPGGTIEMATNELAYYQEYRLWMESYWKLTLLEDQHRDAQTLPRTHFEKKYLERGQICHNLIFQKSLSQNETQDHISL